MNLGMSDCRIRYRVCYQSGVSPYTYRVEWSPEDDEYVGVCIEIPYLTRRAASAHDALTAITEAAEQSVEDMQACGEVAPAPLNERNYSGSFMVRTSPALHARLALEAAEQRVSMNQWIVQRLSDRGLSSSSGLFAYD
jgi:predicted HicB family RNase H-like nuclease